MTEVAEQIPEEDKTNCFNLVKTHFPEITGKIPTRQFLDASTEVVNMIEKFGKVFSPVIYDMNGNIKKLTARYNEDHLKNEYIEDMILKEKMDDENVATDALLWLKRALHFLTSFFFYIIEDSRSTRISNDLSLFLKRAYSESLERHHGWLGTQLFNVLSRFAPTRTNLFYVLALEKHNQEEHVMKDMVPYVEQMKAVVQELAQFYIQNQLELIT